MATICIKAQSSITKIKVDIDALEIFSSNRSSGNCVLISDEFGIINIGNAQLSKLDIKTGDLCKTLTANEVYKFIQMKLKDDSLRFYKENENYLLRTCSQAFVYFVKPFKIEDNVYQCEVGSPIKLSNGNNYHLRGFIQFDKELNLKNFYLREKGAIDLTYFTENGGFYQSSDTIVMRKEQYMELDNSYYPYFTRFVLKDNQYRIDSHINILERPSITNRFGTRDHILLHNRGNLCLTNGEKVVCSNDNFLTVTKEYQLTRKPNECFSNIIQIGKNQYIGGKVILDDMGTSGYMKFCLLDDNFKMVKPLFEYDVTSWYINSIEYLNGKLYLYMYHMEKNYLFLQTLDVAEFIKD